MRRVALRDVNVLAGSVEFCGGIACGMNATRHDVEGIAPGTDGKQVIG